MQRRLARREEAKWFHHKDHVLLLMSCRLGLRRTKDWVRYPLKKEVESSADDGLGEEIKTPREFCDEHQVRRAGRTGRRCHDPAGAWTASSPPLVERYNQKSRPPGGLFRLRQSRPVGAENGSIAWSGAPGQPDLIVRLGGFHDPRHALDSIQPWTT